MTGWQRGLRAAHGRPLRARLAPSPALNARGFQGSPSERLIRLRRAATYRVSCPQLPPLFSPSVARLRCLLLASTFSRRSRGCSGASPRPTSQFLTASSPICRLQWHRNNGLHPVSRHPPTQVQVASMSERPADHVSPDEDEGIADMSVSLQPCMVAPLPLKN